MNTTERTMMNNKSQRNWMGLAVLAVCFATILGGCGSNPDGEGLSDEQKLEGARKARNQQMGAQGGNMPTDRNAMPGANNTP